MAPWLRRLRARIRYRHFGRDLAEELEFHRTMREADLRSDGVEADEARYRASRELGNVLQAREASRGVWLAPWLEGVWQDVRYALRQARRSPGFTVTVALVFGLGIGANTAIFSIVDATHLKPLPFREHWRLFDIRAVWRPNTAEQTIASGMTMERLEAWREQRHIFDAIEPYRRTRAMKFGDSTETITVSQVGDGLFRLLGVEPRLGRGFVPEDNTEAAVVVISDGLWKRACGAAPDVLGSRLRVGGVLRTIIGVMPPRTRFPLGTPPDAWIPLRVVADPKDPTSRIVTVVARLRSGLTPASAQPDLDRAAAAIQQASPPDEPWGVDLDPIDPRRWRSASQPIVLVAFGAATFVVIAACANVANLLLSRALGRRRELAIRGAIGAGRWRIVRQLLLESAVPVVVGCVAAVLLAGWLVRLIPQVLPPRAVSFSAHNPELDLRVLLFAVGASILVGLLSGTLPALRGAGLASATLLSPIGASASRLRPDRQTRNVLVVVQVAFATVLLAGSGLMLNSFARIVAADPGYRTEGLLGVGVTLPENRYPTRPAQEGLVGGLLQQIRSIPGVASAATGTPPPYNTWGRLIAEGTEQDARSAAMGPTTILHAGHDYFRTLGIPILAGRAFSAEDRPGGTPVAIIDEDAARSLWRAENPLGRRVRYSPFVPWITVIGVARSVKTQSVGSSKDSLEIYLPEQQEERLEATVLLVRCSSNPDSVLAAVRDRIRAMDPNVRISRAGLVEDMYDPLLVTPRFTALLLSLFAAMALGTVAVGLYGALSYEVAGRSGEIGVRMALGAARRSVLALVLRDAAKPVLIGAAVGCVLAFWLTRFIAAQLYHVRPHDPTTAAAVLAVLILVALAAAYGPARRATRVDPILVLRAE